MAARIVRGLSQRSLDRVEILTQGCVPVALLRESFMEPRTERLQLFAKG